METHRRKADGRRVFTPQFKQEQVARLGDLSFPWPVPHLLRDVFAGGPDGVAEAGAHHAGEGRAPLAFLERHWRLLLLAVATSACTTSSSGGACTAIFAYITAVAVDAGGQPVTGLAVADTVVRTGHGFAVPQDAVFLAGTVDIFSDNFMGEVRESGDAVRVTGTAAGKGFSASYTFGSDGCHVRKVAGPDTVVVR